MDTFKKYNRITGWLVFLIASFVYLSTMEPTASFWDCGEFIATAYKLEVGHPPGAPLFMLIGRFFSLFTNDPAHVARLINAWSALASALTIMFLFWTITHLVRKIYRKEGDLSTGEVVTILGSGLVGALAYTFTDTFWFSAVEGEVYATSSLITALVFWAILKWENVANEKYANRWLILIFYIIGLSIGIHLLNLLAIPAIVFVYYFRKYEPTPKGFFIALGVSIVLLGTIMYLIIPGTVIVASWFELLFVNGFGLPYNSGVFFYFALLIVLIIWGLRYSIRHNKPLLNTALLAFTVLLIGYSSYTTTVIRSNAEPPMDQNNPDNVFSLLYYLNREQYGERPLFKGPYYNAPILDIKYGKKTYDKEGGKYIVTNRKTEYVYDPRFVTIFPRMYSRDKKHINDYKYWAGIKGRPVSLSYGGRQETEYVPTFGENLRFFFHYQVGFMYLRYFMWNFAGRQNDIQGHGDVMHGNWISGIPFLDNARLGDQDKMPDYLKRNRGHNRYFLLPLLLGLLGAWFHYRRHPKDFWVVLLLFLFTGLAIVVYLNQYPHQPRERDYAYAGSFYAFAIWIGLGVAALTEALPKKIPLTLRGGAMTLLSLLLVPGIMAQQNWDDHDRSGRYTARDFAKNYLNSCAKNAILFTNGDNDTFPLWYVQEVEGVRTDVRVANLSYMSAGWYLDELARKAYDSDRLPFSLSHEQYRSGTRDIVLIQKRLKKYYNLKELIRFVAYDDPKTKIPSPYGKGEMADYFPTNLFSVPVDSAKVVSNGTVPPWRAGQIVKEVKWKYPKKVVYKNDLMVLDLLSNSNWERPIYFAVTIPGSAYPGIEQYLQDEGMAYRFVPIRKNTRDPEYGYVESHIMYDNVMNKFVWGNLSDPHVYLDENNRRMISNFRSIFNRLATTLIREKKVDSARAVVKKCVELLPDRVAPYDYFSLSTVHNAYAVGDTTIAREVAQQLAANISGELAFILSLEPSRSQLLQNELPLDLHILRQLESFSGAYDTPETHKRYMELYRRYAGIMPQTPR